MAKVEKARGRKTPVTLHQSAINSSRSKLPSNAFDASANWPASQRKESL